jgi:Rieske Fe-S protein
MSTHDQTPNEPGDELTPEPNQLDGTGSVERYVRLHDYIEQLRAEKRPAQAGPLPAEDADAYRMAAFLHAAAPGASEPDPAFVANLQARILGQMHGNATPEALQPTPQPTPEPLREIQSAQVASSSSPPVALRPRTAKKSVVSRRSLLGTGLGAAAAIVGVAAGMQIEQHISPPPAPEGTLVPEGSGIWVAVASADTIPVGGVKRFATDYVVGFIRHTSEGFTALSGICTHQGCMLLWNSGDRTFDCPCHGGRFTEQGNSAPGSQFSYRPLPAIQTKVENGKVMVYVVPPQQTPNVEPTATDPTSDHSYNR